MKPAVYKDAPKGAPSSSSTPPPQVQLSGGQTSTSKPFEMTRANLDQWKRNVKAAGTTESAKIEFLASRS